MELAEPLRLCADKVAVTAPSGAPPPPPSPPKLHAAAGWPVVNDLDARQLRGEAYHTPQPGPELFDELGAPPPRPLPCPSPARWQHTPDRHRADLGRRARATLWP